MTFPVGRTEDHHGMNGKRWGYIFWHLSAFGLCSLQLFSPPQRRKKQSQPQANSVPHQRQQLTGEGTAAPSHLFAWSSALQQAQAALLEAARCPHSDTSSEPSPCCTHSSLFCREAAALLLVLLLPSPCAFFQAGSWRGSGGSLQGMVFSLHWDLLC